LFSEVHLSMKKKQPLISIVIPLYKVAPQFYEAVYKCLELNYSNYEIIIGIDKGINLPLRHPKVIFMKTRQSRTGPGEKRDLAISKAKGEYIAFLDDDSYPDRNWLKKALLHLQKQKVEVVCGPGLTPPANGFSQKLTGAILASYFGSGPFYFRFIKATPRYVDDYPAYNLIASKRVLRKVGGYGTKFYGGEDTALCLKIINLGYKIFYHPDITVYHHRRAFPQGYFKQVGNVGLHRGYFVKIYPKTSLRFVYFLPTLITLSGVILIIYSIFDFGIALLIISSLGLVYYFSVFIESIRKNQLHITLLLPPAIFISHIVYGYYFFKGLLMIKNLKR